MTKIKGTEEHGLLQTIIPMIWPLPCSSVPLKMVICKKGAFPDDQNQRDGGAGIVANDHLDDPASSFLLHMSFAKNTVLKMTKTKGTEKHRLLQMTIWMIRPPPCSSVPLQMVICTEEGPTDDQHFFGRIGLKFAPDLPLV